MNAASKNPNPLIIVAVSAYLLAAGIWLVMTRQIPSPGFLRILRALARRPYRGNVEEIAPEQGFCYCAHIAADLLSDRESSSSLCVFEDGRPLGPAHAAHNDIRRLGKGRFSHWGRDLYFSASDNSDPRRNGRRYTLAEVQR